MDTNSHNPSRNDRLVQQLRASWPGVQRALGIIEQLIRVSSSERTQPEAFAFPPGMPDLSPLAAADEDWREAVFPKYAAVRDELTAKQWAVVALRYRDGKTQSEIASILGSKRSAVCALLRRARERRESKEQSLRREFTEVMQIRATSRVSARHERGDTGRDDSE